jgi:hypothetical protein
MNYVRREFIQGAPVSKNYYQHSPSALNLFAAQPSMFVLEKILGLKQPVGAVAHRGTAIEDGVAHGLKDPKASDADSIKIAQAKFDLLTAMSGDARREKYRADIPDMVTTALDELRPYGVPTDTQGFITWQPEGLRLPIVGYFDFKWEDKGIIVDLKTTDRMPSEIKIAHARQVSLYAMSDNQEGRLTYTTPKKVQTLRLENIREHRQALLNIARKVENFLALSEDPAFFTQVTAPDLDSFYWSSPAARQLAFDHWGV